MELRYIHFKEIDLDTENRFTVDLTENNSIKNIKFSSRENYFITSLKVKTKIKTDITKCNDYHKIHQPFELCCALNKNNKKTRSYI